MSEFFNDTMQGLLEAVAMEKGNIPLTERKNMAAPTYYVVDKGDALIEELVSIRKTQNISQSQLAALTGNKQQVISRMEKKENSPSLKLFCNIVNALGYELKLVKTQQ